MRNRTPIVATLIVLFFSICATAGEAWAQGNSIRGKVRNSSGVNMPRVLVSLQTGNGGPIGQTVTNNEGDFFFGDLSETGFVLVISIPDYNPVTEQVNFSRSAGPNNPGELRTVEITLVPSSNSRITPGRVTFAQNVPRPARDAYERGVKLARASKSPESIAALREAIGLFPDYFDARFALGQELIKTGRLNDAIPELDQARRINPKDDRVYRLFGLLLMQQKKHAVAAAVFAEAANLSPGDPQHPLMRGTALIEHASTIDPSKSKRAADERNLALGGAEKALARAYELSGKKLAAVHQQMARLYERRGERARAADELEQYLRKTPDAKNADAIREAIKKLRSSSSSPAGESKTSPSP